MRGAIALVLHAGKNGVSSLRTSDSHFVDKLAENRPLKCVEIADKQPLSTTIVYNPVKLPHSAAFTRTSP